MQESLRDCSYVLLRHVRALSAEMQEEKQKTAPDAVSQQRRSATDRSPPPGTDNAVPPPSGLAAQMAALAANVAVNPAQEQLNGPGPAQHAQPHGTPRPEARQATPPPGPQEPASPAPAPSNSVGRSQQPQSRLSRVLSALLPRRSGQRDSSARPQQSPRSQPAGGVQPNADGSPSSSRATSTDSSQDEELL